MNKYRAGGRCGGSGSERVREVGLASGAESALSRLIAAREAQDSAFGSGSGPGSASASATAIANNNQQSLTIQKKPIQDKKSCIDIILAGDIYE